MCPAGVTLKSQKKKKERERERERNETSEFNVSSLHGKCELEQKGWGGVNLSMAHSLKLHHSNETVSCNK